ncbi:hypothetical protein [Nonomuraea sp. NPDC003201]
MLFPFVAGGREELHELVETGDDQRRDRGGPGRDGRRGRGQGAGRVRYGHQCLGGDDDHRVPRARVTAVALVGQQSPRE